MNQLAEPRTGLGMFRNYIDNAFTAEQVDKRRTELLKKIQAATGRHVLVYAADPAKQIRPEIDVALSHGDITSFIEVIESIPKGTAVDFVLESPGGSAQVAELLVRLLRQRFTSVRFIVPHMAMSAATILAMSGDEILMDHRGSLGPIDPQILKAGQMPYPAQSYIDWLEKAAAEEKTNNRLSLVTLAILQKVTPADIQIAEDATEEARKLVAQWLVTYMWAGLTMADGSPMPAEQKMAKARNVAERLASHKEWLSHGKMLSGEMLKRLDPDLRITDYSTLPCGDQIWELWVNLHYTFGTSPSVKVFESASSRLVKLVQIGLQPQPQQGVPPQAARAGHAGVKCGRCGAEYQFQANFELGVPLTPGALLWPPGDRQSCRCGNLIDLAPVRAQLEQATGKKIVH